MKEYIEREAFIEAKRKQYCADCDRRKGMKNGKMRFCYDIGEAPCRACSVDDMLNDVEDFPAADVVLRSCFDRILAENDDMREQLKSVGKLPGDDMSDLEVVRHGRWIDSKEDGHPSICGVCNYPVDRFYKTKYCPNCGAKMMEAQE